MIEKTEETRRSYLFDNIKALLIFCVVYAHFLRVGGHFETGSPSRMIYIICFTFMMQGFFFISGYFSKNVDKCRKKAVETFLLPFIVMTVLTFGERYLLFGNAHLQFIRPTHALWFLLAMFIYRFCIKTVTRIPYLLPISFAVYMVVGGVAFLGPVLALQRIFSFFFFFVLGYFCQSRHIEYIRKLPKPLMLIPTTLLLCYAWLYCRSGYGAGALMYKRSWQAMGMTVGQGLLSRLGVAIAALLCLIIIFNLMPDRRLFTERGIVSQIGSNTMTVYLLHIFVRYLVKWCAGKGLIPGDWGGAVYCLFLLGVACLCAYLFSRPAVARIYDKMTFNRKNS